MEDSNLSLQASPSKLPKSLTTVTPFSKFLATTLFITLPFFGFYLGVSYQKMIAPVYPSITIPKTTFPSIFPTPIPLITAEPTMSYSARDAINPYFKKYFIKFFDVNLYSGKLSDKYYTSLSVGCAGSGSPGRVLSARYISFLDEIGLSASNNKVYILKTNLPLPKIITAQNAELDEFGSSFKNILISPASRVLDIPTWLSNTKDNTFPQNWNNFLLNQKNDYPLLIIKKSEQKYVIYVRDDYFYVPGC